jgi:hypothetical protein
MVDPTVEEDVEPVSVMRCLRPVAFAVLLLPVSVASAFDQRVPDSADAEGAGRSGGSVVGAGPLARVPVHFEPNRGQDESDARFVARRDGWQTSILRDGARFRFTQSPRSGVTQRIRGADPDALVQGVEALPGRSNYFLGADPSKWLTRVPHFGGVRIRRVLPGVDLRWTGLSGGRIRYDFELDAGVDPSVLEMEIRGARRVALASDGALVMETPEGTIRQSRPVAWQPDRERRVPVACRFAVSGNRVRFSTGALDPDLPLVVDPTIELEFREHGGDIARGFAVAMDDQSNPILGGETRGPSFPILNALQSSVAGSRDFFISKFAAGGSTLLWSTYLGGVEGETFYGLALGPDDSVFVCGYTGTGGGATAWPVKNAFQSTPGGGFRDGALAKLGPDGDSLEYASYLGGDAIDDITAICVDADGQARVAGFTHSRNFPLVNHIYTADESFENPGDNTGFLAKVSASGSTLMASTYLGSISPALGIAIDGAGEVWVVGVTPSDEFQTFQPYQIDLTGTTDAYVIKCSEDHELVLFSTYFGGSGGEEARGVAVDADGDAIVVGFTTSTDYPELDGLPGDPSGANAFVARIDGESLELEWSTALGGTGADEGFGVAIDGSGGIVVAGMATSSDFPTVSPTQASRAGMEDFFVTRFSSDGSEITFSTYYGTGNREVAQAVATDGAVIVANGLSSDTASVVAASFRIMFDGIEAVAISGDEVNLAWGESCSGPFDVEIERRVGAGAFSQVAVLEPDSTGWSDTDVDEETVYEYRVRGVAENGATAWTGPPPVTNPPLAPAGLTAIATSNESVELTWTDRATVELSYEVRRRTEPGGALTLIATIPAGSESYVDDGAVPDAVYTYVVGATGASGAVGLSEAYVSMPPADPEVFSVVGVSDIEVQATWTDVATTESGYEIQRRDDDAAGGFQTIESTDPGQSEFRDEPVQGEHGYTYRCRAFSANGVSAWSPERSLRTPPRAPSGHVALASTPERIVLSWTDESSVETGYRIESRLESDTTFAQIAIRPADSISLPVDGLLQETSYVFRVQAFGAWGNSRWIETQPVPTPSQMTVSRARLTPAKGARTARLIVAASFDLGTADIDLSGPATVRIGDSAIPVDAFLARGKSPVLRHETDELSITLRPSRSGGSAVGMELRATGAVAEGIDPEGVLRIEFKSGAFTAAGGARLEAGRFDPRAGVGERETPSIGLASFRALVKSGSPHSFTLGASFAPRAVSALPPVVGVAVGESDPISFPQNRFLLKGDRWVLDATDLGDWHVVYQPTRGRLTVRVGGLDLGEYREGLYPLRIEFNVGPDRFLDTPILSCDGRRLGP